MSDDDAISGEQAGYVPCADAPAVQPAPDDTSAVWGEEEGRVPPDQSALAETAPDDDAALYGTSAGYVAKPCPECSADELAHDLFERTVTSGQLGDPSSVTNTTGMYWRGGAGIPDGHRARMQTNLNSLHLALTASNTDAAAYKVDVATDVFHVLVEGLEVYFANGVDFFGSPTRGWWWNVSGETLFSYEIKVESTGGWSFWGISNSQTMGDPGTFLGSGLFTNTGNLDVEITDNGGSITINGVTFTALSPVITRARVDFHLFGNTSNTADSTVGPDGQFSILAYLEAIYLLGPTICV